MKAFISYCRQDEKENSAKTKLKKSLVQIEKEYSIDIWNDELILGGKGWEGEIQKNLSDSFFVLALISRDYLASESCMKELNFAIDHDKYIIPIIIRDCDWKPVLGKIQVLPKDANPVLKWDDEDSAWLDISKQIRAIIESLSFIPQKSYLEELERIDFISSTKEQIKLSDIFVWPSASTVNEKVNPNIEELSLSIFEDKKKCRIIGDQLSGKTSILRKTYIEALEHSYMPVFLNGSEIKHKTKQFESIIERAVKQQYDKYSLDDISKNILLVDDYNHFISEDFLTYSQNIFSIIIVVCSTEENIMYLSTSPVFSSYTDFQIEPMFAKKRKQLISKWKSLDRLRFATDEEYQLSIDNLCSEVKEIIGKQVVPSYPFHVLGIIQAKEVLPQDFSFSAYGHCYHGLIVAIFLKKGIKGNEIDSCINYLTDLSNFIYEKGRIGEWVISIDEYQYFKELYVERYLIDQRVINYLEDQSFKIILIKDSKVSFDRLYLFYYFVGKWFSENKTDEVNTLCDKIYLKDFSEILIFIIHHSTSNDLIDSIVLHCMCSYEKVSPVKLTKNETSFMDDLMDSIPKQIETRMSVEENRETVIHTEDQEERQLVSQKEDFSKYEDEEYRNLVVGFRLLDVIGQVLKNRSGSINKNTIENILYEVEQLGLRILGYFLETIKSEDFLQWLIKRLDSRFKGKTLKADEIERVARRYVAAYCNFNIILMLVRISNAVSSRILLRVQKKLAEKDGPAYELLYVIQHLSLLGMDNPNFIIELHNKYTKEDDKWADTVLGLIVQSYFHYYKVTNEIIKQKICSAFKWDIKRI